MYIDILRDPRFYLVLYDIDVEIARKTQEQPCAHCNDVVDTSDYQRKPRGLPIESDERLSRRFSFCCRRDGCRRRLTPQSLRFAGRRVWVLTVILALSDTSESGMSRLISLTKVPRQTIRRWRQWWSHVFLNSQFWRQARARFIDSNDMRQLPGQILDTFWCPDREFDASFILALRFFAMAWSPLSFSAKIGFPAEDEAGSPSNLLR